MKKNKFKINFLLIFVFLFLIFSNAKADLIFSESFENNNWSARGWYDGTDSVGVQSGGHVGNALRWNWGDGATQPTGFSTIRNSFTQTDELFIEYYMKFDNGWRGSGLTYHPHMIHLQSVDDDIWQGLSRANNSIYLEAISEINSPYNIIPIIATQDFYRVNTTYGTPPNDLTATTETRSAYHCNTPASLSGATGICYNDGGGWYSANMWSSPEIIIPKDQWVKVEAYFKKNTFGGGVANFDGTMQMWINDELAIDKSTVLYATNYYNTTQWDKIILAPWIGDGSPIAQSMWLDEFKIYDSLPSGGDTNPPSAPIGLNVL